MRRQAALMIAAAAALAACSELPSGAQVTYVVLSTESVTMELGDTARLSVTVTDARGTRLAAAVHWGSNDPQVVLVSEGLLTSVGTGATTVTVESGGVGTSAIVTVGADLVTVTAGATHTCSITAPGHAACWGANGAGQLGSGTIFSSAAPQLARAPSAFSATAQGLAHSCGLTPAGEAYCWGWNLSGQLGLGQSDENRHAVPERVAGGTRLESITAGDRHTCGLTADGTAYCWGGGLFGQLGSGTPTDFCATFGEACNLRPVPVAASLALRALSAGRDHTCGVTVSGEAYCWGRNPLGQLGDSSTTARDVPTPVYGGIVFHDIAAGGLHTCALVEDGSAHCWGSNLSGQLGIGTPEGRMVVPSRVATNVRFTSLSAGEEHTCGIATDQTLWCWGSNAFGQLGVVGVALAAAPTMTEGPKFETVTTGDAHTCGLATDERVYCWGWNGFGQLGTSGPSRAAAVAVTGQ